MIRCENLSVHYGNKIILDNINLEIDEKGLLIILGKNGCGKSTLLKAIDNLIKYEGLISIDGNSKLKNIERALRTSYLPQSRVIPSITVLDMVLYGRYPHGENKENLDIALNALRVFKMEKYKDVMLDKLSGGERQRAYLAMAWAQESNYILLDEADIYLDILSKLEFFELIKEMSKDKRVILVTHDLANALLYGDDFLLMDNGTIVNYGKKEQAIKKISDVFDIEITEIKNKYIIEKR